MKTLIILDAIVDPTNPFLWLIAVAIWLGLLYLVISQASNADKLLKEAKKQTSLLVKIAKQSGVNTTEIEQVTGNEPY